MVPRTSKSTVPESTSFADSITGHSATSLGFPADETVMHPDLFQDFQPTAASEFYLSLTASQSMDEVTFDQKFIDPRQLFFAGCNNQSIPLTTSSMFANRGVLLASTPSSPPDTPKAKTLDLTSESPSPLMLGRRAAQRSSMSSLSVSFAPSLEDSRPRKPIRTHNSQQAPTPSALKGNSKGKVRSSTNVASRSASTPLSSHTRSASQPDLATAKSQPSLSSPSRTKLQIPLSLPRPKFAPMVTDPHVDVAKHLHRVGLHSKSSDAEASGWTASYALNHVRRMVGEGGNPWKLALWTNENAVDPKAFVTAAAQSKTIKLQIPTAELLSCSSSSSALPPSHVLAVVPSSTELNEGVASVLEKMKVDTEAMSQREDPTLFPIHAFLYALQCRSLPDDCFHPAKDPQQCTTSDSAEKRTVRVMQVRVPKPSTFGITHDFICTGSAQRLLNSLVPLKFINETLKQRQAERTSSIAKDEGSTPRPGHHSADLPSSKSTDTSKLTPQAQAIQVLADLSTKQLLHLMGVITSVYANGIALGLVDTAYWKTLAAAWELVVGGVAIRRGRQTDAELKAVRHALGGLGLDGSRQ
ncbi:hypothetical protein CF327_g2707 [Tilletia walkeri]|uniref:Uncharacterized protein n=1 Tax=Tilletia walkeri TaxID=117179 RepID=A0A8X7T5M1_9BASI|nr:hypothetical protein CF327_g2707 [Tilletia walkeri]KAE8269354.1 hypothetical protein A4X09_0g2999 [Tilletia walkeri]